MVTNTISSSLLPNSSAEGILTEDTLHQISVEISRHYVLFRYLNDNWGPELPRWLTGMVEPQLSNALRLDCLDMRDNFASTEQPFTFCPILYHVRNALFDSLLDPTENSYSVSLQPVPTAYPPQRLSITVSKQSDQSVQLMVEQVITKEFHKEPSVKYTVKLSVVREIDATSQMEEYDRSEIDTPEGSTSTFTVTDDPSTSFQTALECALETFFPCVSNQWEKALLRQPKAREFVTKLVKQLPRAHDIHFERCLSMWASFPQDVQTILHTKVHPEYLPLTKLQGNLMEELCSATQDLLNLAACGPNVMRALQNAEMKEHLRSSNTCSSYLGSADCFRNDGSYCRELPMLHHLWIAMFEGFKAVRPPLVVLNMVGATTSRQRPSITINTSEALDDILSCEISYNGRRHSLYLSGDGRERKLPTGPRRHSFADCILALFPDSSPWRKVFPSESSQYKLFSCIVKAFPHKSELGYDHCRKLWNSLPEPIQALLPSELSYAYPMPT